MAKQGSGALGQHKRLAMGEKVGFKGGGSVPSERPLKTGIPDTPIEKAKIDNGIPGMRKGGKVDKDSDCDKGMKKGGRVKGKDCP